MSKKNKRNLKALLAKRQKLQSLQSSAVSIPGAPQRQRLSAAPALEDGLSLSGPPAVKALPPFQPNKEVWRTVVSTVAIALLLGGIVIFDQQRPFLTEFGNILYRTLRLNS
jgi:hypothetical protein